MQSLHLFTFFMLALATLAQKDQSRLSSADTDDHKQLLIGKVSVEDFTLTFTQATQSVVSSSENGDTATFEQSVTTVVFHASELDSYVQTLDGRQAVSHRTTIVEVFASYISMINVISKTADDKVSSCHNQLVEINAFFLNITSTYKAKGVDLCKLLKQRNDVQYDPAQFDALHLAHPFPDDSNDQAVDQTQTQNNVSKDGANDDQ